MKSLRGFSLVELVLVLVIIACVSRGGNALLTHHRQQSYARTFAQHFFIYENAIAMYWHQHNGNFPATFTNGASLNSITDLQAYFPNNFTKINLPSFNGKTCTYTLAITLNKTTKEVSELTIVLKTLSDTKLTSAIKKIMSESVYDGRITVQSDQVKYTLKTSSMSYL